MKQKLYDLLVISTVKPNKKGKYLAYFISILIILNVVALILETVESLYVQWEQFFYWFELISVVIFTVEYILRIWVATVEKRYRQPFKGRLKYVASPLAIIDLLAILPFYLPLVVILDLRFLRMLRLFRLFRLFKLARYMKAMRTLGDVFKDKKEELVLTLLVVFALMIISSSIMYMVEHEAQPEKFSSIPETMWWAVITLTTVGYGDAFPITVAGRFIASIISILGVGLIALPAAIIASGFVDRIRKAPVDICPHCGKKLI